VFDFFEMMRAAPGGAGFEQTARGFGVSGDALQAALTAAAPAFLMALQRSALRNPTGFADLMGRMARPANPFDPRAYAAPEPDLAAQLFGGAEATRRIAEQTAALAGVAPEAMARMMPWLASAFMGGLSQEASRQGLADVFSQIAETLRRGGKPPPNPQDAYREVMRAMFGGQGAPTKPPERNPWEDFFGGLFGLPPKPEPPPPQPEPTPAAGSFDAMMRAMFGAPPEPPKPAPEPEPAPANPYEGWSQALRAGQEAQAQQMKALQTIFETVWSADRTRA